MIDDVGNGDIIICLLLSHGQMESLGANSSWIVSAVVCRVQYLLGRSSARYLEGVHLTCPTLMMLIVDQQKNNWIENTKDIGRGLYKVIMGWLLTKLN